MKHLTPTHQYELDPNGIEDSFTNGLCLDAIKVGSSSMKGQVIGLWLEARVSALVAQWLPNWVCSHAQITDANDTTMQSRTWDVVVHRPIPTGFGYPPPSHPPHGYPLVPKHLCCALINVKGNLSPSQLRAAMNEPAYQGTEDSTIKQMDYLGPDLPKIYLCFTSYASERAMSDAAIECGVEAFTLARLNTRRKSLDGRAVYHWTLNRTRSGDLPLTSFRQCLEGHARRREERDASKSRR